MGYNRREFLQTSSVALAVGAFGRLPAFAQQPAAPVATSFVDVRRNVGIFNGRGGTIGWLINPNGVLIVDSQFPDTAKTCLEGLKQKSSRPIDALVNTHHHGDHTGGNAVFKPAVKMIVAHQNVPDLQKKQAAAQNPPLEQAFPDKTFATTWKLDLGDETISAKHYGPGHTGGDIVVTFEKANVVHMGDLMFHTRHPRVDRPAGASIKNWSDSLSKVTGEHTDDTIYIAGHSKEGLPVQVKKADLLAFRDYFTAVLDHVQKGISAGKSKDEITKLAALPKFESYAENPPVLTLSGVLTVAYEELTSKTS